MSLGRRPPKAANLAAAALYGAVLALVIAYAGSYVLTRYGLGVVAGSRERRHGPAVFARAALNLYAVQHVALVGAGTVTDALGNRESLTARITLPLTVWAGIPAIALMIGGCCAARSRAAGGRGAMSAAAVLCGIVYALALAVAARWAEARIDAFLMPEIGGTSPNPPQIPFRPSTPSALALCTGLGVVFAYVGGLIAIRAAAVERARTKWWACCKAAVVAALAVQVLIAGSVLAWSLTRGRPQGDEKPRIAEMLPTAAGLGYAMIHGADLVSSVESRFIAQRTVQRAFHARVSLYTGITQDGSHKAVPRAVWVAGLLVAISASILCGFLAVKWGSRDGWLPTGLRCGLLHTVYVAAMIRLCNIELAQANPVAASVIQVRALFTPGLILSFVGVAVFSLFGARLVGRRHTSAIPGAG
jgi:hypothetical protein